MKFIKLKTPIPMKEVFDLEELEYHLNRTKLRFTFKDFDYYKKNIVQVRKAGNRFHEFKIKIDFKQDIKKPNLKENKSLRDITSKWLQSIKDKEVREELENEFKAFSNNGG